MQFDNDGGAPASGAEHMPSTIGGTTGAEQEGVVSLIEDEEEVLGNEADPEDEDSDSDNDDAESDSAPRRRSRSQRYKERITRLTAELDAERRRSRATVGAAYDHDLVEPREEDFANDYLAYDRALRDYQVRRALREERGRDAQAQARLDAEAAFRDKLGGYNTRLEALKTRIPDFDQVLRETSRVEIRNDVRDLILGSAKGPLIAYYLAKNPEALHDINRMPPNEAARKIGNIEARIRGPNPATATKARPPFAPLRGGASGSRALDPERMSHDDYRKARSEGRI
jgi:hypothetical protein